MVVNCPLCNYRFNTDESKACSGCPLGGNCDKVCCPNCQYGWIESSQIVGSLMNTFRKKGYSGKS